MPAKVANPKDALPAPITTIFTVYYPPFQYPQSVSGLDAPFLMQHPLK
jgi:hypothetical protein